MIAVESLRNLSKLKFLDLFGNNLSVLKRDIFSGLRSPSVKLGHNPWDGSCELQDFGAFLQELLNAFLLEDASSVTCHSPAVRGFPVRNISDFGCQPTFLPASLGSVLDKTMVLVALVCVVLLVLLWVFLVLWKVKYNRVHRQPGKRIAVGTCRKECIRPWKSRGHPNRKRQVTIEEVTSQVTVVEQLSRSALANLSSSEHSGGNLGPFEQTGQTPQLELPGVDSGCLNSFYHHKKKLNAPVPWTGVEFSCKSTFCMSKPIKEDLSTLEMSGIEGGDTWVENTEALEYFTMSVKKSSCPSMKSPGIVQNRTLKPLPLKRSQMWPQEGGIWIKEQSSITDIPSISAKDSQDEAKDAEIYEDLRGDLHMQENPKPLFKRISKPRFTRKLAQLGRYQRTREFIQRPGKVGQDGASASLSVRSDVSPASSLENTQSFDKSQALACDLLHEVVENHGRWTRSTGSKLINQEELMDL